ncbi:MAG: hypothetical protein ACLFQK_10270, partial [Fibrobacterota bacterium]
MLLILRIPGAAADNYALEMSRIPVGIREASMGGAGSAVPEGPSSVYYNCASMMRGNKPALEFSYSPLFGGLSDYSSFSAVFPARNSFAVGAAYLHHETDDIPVFDTLLNTAEYRLNNFGSRSDGVPSGSAVNIQEQVLIGISKLFTFEVPRVNPYSVKLPFRAGGGLTIKYHKNYLALPGSDFSGIGQSLDFSFYSDIALSADGETGETVNRISAGINLRDALGSSINWNTGTADPVRGSVQYGLGYMHRFPEA